MLPFTLLYRAEQSSSSSSSCSGCQATGETKINTSNHSCRGMARIQLGDMYCNGVNGMSIDKAAGRKYYVAALQEDGYDYDDMNMIGMIAQKRINQLEEDYQKKLDLYYSKMGKHRNRRRRRRKDGIEQGGYSLEDDDTTQSWTKKLYELYKVYDETKIYNSVTLENEIKKYRHNERSLFLKLFKKYKVPAYEQSRYIRLKYDPCKLYSFSRMNTFFFQVISF